MNTDFLGTSGSSFKDTIHWVAQMISFGVEKSEIAKKLAADGFEGSDAYLIHKAAEVYLTFDLG